APMIDERLQKPNESRRQLATKRALHDLVLALRTHARRLEKDAQAAVALHRVRDPVDHLAPPAQIASLLRELEERLSVVPGDGRLAHGQLARRVPSNAR